MLRLKEKDKRRKKKNIDKNRKLRNTDSNKKQLRPNIFASWKKKDYKKNKKEPNRKVTLKNKLDLPRRKS
jgi:hypothetical protein